MKRFTGILAAALLLSACGPTDKILTGGEIIRLYKEDAPGYGDLRVSEVNAGKGILFNIQNPTLQAFPAENPNGTAVLVVPGGGFFLVSYEGEGVDVAKELNEKGITAFVLKYRVNPALKENGEQASDMAELTQVSKTTYLKNLGVVDKVPEEKEERTSWQALHTPYSSLALEDADNAIRYIRAHAGEYGIKKLGMVGFSAGALITMNQVLNHQPETRPDFAGVIYGGWYEQLEAPQDAMPLFFCSPVLDVFAAEESWWMYKAWRDAHVPVEIHDFSKAVHGYGAGKDGTAKDAWIELFCAFLKDCKFL